jgi:transcription initiation factor TFIIH subunit 3
MMNAMFAAQSSNILIDCLCLNEKESSFLQQAAFVSGGIYAKPEKSKKGGGEETRENLLERALCSFLPDRYTRRFLRPPRAGSIDFRSSCFCHGNRISKGFVCSVCLSVFCEKEGSCQTCGAAFV